MEYATVVLPVAVTAATTETHDATSAAVVLPAAAANLANAIVVSATAAAAAVAANETIAIDTTIESQHDATSAAVVLPVAAANLATAIVVSATAAAAAAVVNETIANDTTQVQQKDLGGDASVDAQHFESVYHNQQSTGPQGALETVMASTKVTLERDRCIDSLDQLITKLSTLNDKSSGISPGFDCIDNKLPWKQVGVFPQYETLDSVNEKRGMIPLPSPESTMELFKMVKFAWQKRVEYEMCETIEEKESYCSCISSWRPKQNIMKQICNQVIEQVMAREASACLRAQPSISRVWNEAYAPDTCPHPDTMDCLYLDSLICLLTAETYLHSYVEAALAATSTSEYQLFLLY